MTTGQETPTFSEWLQDVATMASLGYVPIVTVLRDHAGEMFVFAPARGDELGALVGSLADQDPTAGPPTGVPAVPASKTATEREKDRAEFATFLRERRTEGLHPMFIIFLGEDGAVRSLGGAGSAEMRPFLRWLSLEVAEPVDEEGS